jgi:hypothetical protein
VQASRQQRRSIGADSQRPRHAENRLAGGAGYQRKSDCGYGIDRHLSTDSGQIVGQEERGGKQQRRKPDIGPPWQSDRSAAAQERAGERLVLDIVLRAEQSLRLDDENDQQRTEGDEVMRAVAQP